MSTPNHTPPFQIPRFSAVVRANSGSSHAIYRSKSNYFEAVNHLLRLVLCPRPSPPNWSAGFTLREQELLTTASATFPMDFKSLQVAEEGDIEIS